MINLDKQIEQALKTVNVDDAVTKQVNKYIEKHVEKVVTKILDDSLINNTHADALSNTLGDYLTSCLNYTLDDDERVHDLINDWAIKELKKTLKGKNDE